MAVQYAPTKLRVPPGFQNILEGFAREVLREQPQDIIQFGAQYFKAQLAIRDETGKDDAKRGENLEKLQKGEDVDIDLDDPQVQAAATKIQAGFRGHKAREEVKHKKEEEAAALKIQSSFRGHKAREQVQELKESRSRESTEPSPVKELEKPAEDEVDIDLNDPEVQGAALKIQASFRGHKARSEVQKMKSSETVAAEVKDEGQKEVGEVAAAANQPSESAPKEEEIDIDLNDPQVEKAATVIQSSFRAHQSRESVKIMTEKEESEEPKEDAVDKGEEGDVVVDAAGQQDAPAVDKEEEIDIDLSDPEVNKAATKIQASFRGHQTRKELRDKSPTTSQESVKAEEASAADDVAPETALGQQPEPEAESKPQEAADTQESPADTEDKDDVAAPESAEVAPETESGPQEETKVEEQEAEPTAETQESTPQADDTDKPAPEDGQAAEDQAES